MALLRLYVVILGLLAMAVPAIAETLRALGFTLVGGGALLDLDKAALDSAVQRFGAALQGADVGLFYYAGHGVQVRGSNYLIPVGANPVREADIDFQMLDTALVLRQMEAAGTRLNLVVLDACRNNPFGGRGLRSTASGLAQMTAPEGTLISFATQPGNVALDGTSGNSPYTAALVQTLRRPGLDVFQTFNAVGLAVKRSTAGAQQPWVSSSPIAGNFYFSGAQGAQPPSGPGPVAAPAFPGSETERARAVTKDSSSIAVMEDFVRQFGATPYGSMARARLEELRIEQRRRAAPEPGRLPRAPAPAAVSPPPAAASVPASTSMTTRSFDCATHRAADEVVICRSGRLARLDRRLDALHAATRSRLNRALQLVLRDEQRAWLKRRAACAASESCLIAVYESRIAELQAWR